MIYVGIDPGLFGAVAALTDEKFLWVVDTPIVSLRKNGRTRHEYDWPHMRNLALSVSAYTPPLSVVAIEEVHTMPLQGVASQGRLMYGLGLWHGLLIARGCSVERVSPQTWKKVMLKDLGDKGKEAARWRASQLFPEAASLLSRVKDHGRAEALLLAEYIRRIRRIP